MDTRRRIGFTANSQLEQILSNSKNYHQYTRTEFAWLISLRAIILDRVSLKTIRVQLNIYVGIIKDLFHIIHHAQKIPGFRSTPACFVCCLCILQQLCKLVILAYQGYIASVCYWCSCLVPDGAINITESEIFTFVIRLQMEILREIRLNMEILRDSQIFSKNTKKYEDKTDYHYKNSLSKQKRTHPMPGVFNIFKNHKWR